MKLAKKKNMPALEKEVEKHIDLVSEPAIKQKVKENIRVKEELIKKNKNLNKPKPVRVNDIMEDEDFEDEE